jgi:large subunit ribosomal protein L24
MWDSVRKPNKANKRIRVGDKVIVLSGDDKGTIGEVIARKGNKLKVSGVNEHKKHLKSQEGKKSNIVTIELPIDASNVAFADKEGNPCKLRYRKNDGKKEIYSLDKEKKEQLVRSL